MKTLAVTRTAPLLKFLEESFPDLTRTEVKRFLKFESVMVNGRAVTQFDWKLKPGDDVRMLSKGETRGLSGLGNVKIVYEDDTVLVADKPPGLLTVATEKEREKTLYFRLMHYMREKSRGRERVFIVHRLDREVSGLLVFAKTEEAKLKLQKNWNRFEKIYLAVVEGAPPCDSGTVRSFLTEDALGNVTSSDRPTRDAKEAITDYAGTHTFFPASAGKKVCVPAYTLLKISIQTGRKHQIRIHMADLGCPITGDDRYGAQTDPIGRLALHAAHLRFTHPATNQPLSFTLPPPKSFSTLTDNK